MIDNELVGTNLSDHPLVPMYFSISSNQTWDDVLRDTSVFDTWLSQWLSSKTGLFVDTPGNTQSFYRIPANDPIYSQIPDPSAGNESAHLESIYVVRRLVCVDTSTAI